jgi:dephospho-CoA kinase
MKLCGLTGGVGMGKSTAAGFLLAAGARVVDTDDLAHELVQPGQPALVEITAAFGKNIIAPDGTLQRRELAKIVFGDAAARQKLEGILHPRIRERWEEQAAGWRRENCPVGVVVIPLLFETQAEGCFDKIICMACSAASQRERLAARGWTPEQIGQRIASQMPVEQKMARSHYVVWSEGLPEVTRRQIGEILRVV